MARRKAPQAQLRIEWDTPAPASPAPSAIVAALAPPPPPPQVVAVASDAPPRKGYDRALADRAVAGAASDLLTATIARATWAKARKGGGR